MKHSIEGVSALTFDCYGTIIDWDGGILAALAALPSLGGCDFERLVRERETEEYALLEGEFALYGNVLGESLRRAAALQGREPTADEVERFVQSMGGWPAFADSAGALATLGATFRLALLSNVENATLARSAQRLGIADALRITAEDVRSYKPARGHFDAALRALELPADAVLHVACSLYHDVRPARALGWRTVWINRRGDPVPDDLDAADVYPDLAAFARDCG